MNLVTVTCSDPRGHRLAVGLNAHQVNAKRGTILITPARHAKWLLLFKAGFDVSGGQRKTVFSRRSGPKLLLSQAMMIAEAIAETRQPNGEDEPRREKKD